MTESKTCPKCHAPLPADAPEGLCPACLLKAGFAGESKLEATEASPAASKGFVPPTPEELTARFPQLEIIELLGRGGMGAVYKARQKGLHRLVAVKILPPEVGADAAFAERFTREARALAQLSHPNIVGVYDFGQTDGLYYFVMEYVDGVNLRQAILSGGMAPKEVLSVVPQICDALQFAHDEGIVHRDIKPENILIDKRGRVKIADFGLAKLLGQEQADHRLTGTHQVMGTLRYMAPEQFEGSKVIDHRADIYSLGVVFYELLTGELPIGRFALPSQKVEIDVRLDEVVLRALEQKPEQRWQHASDVKSELDIIRSSPGSSAAASVSESNELPIKRSPPKFSEPASDARLSLYALAGALCAPLVFVVFGLVILGMVTLPASATDVGGIAVPEQGSSLASGIKALLAAGLGLIGVAAPFGTTILGSIAIGQIRRSAGKLYGLPLAVFDALLFPLLLLDIALLALALLVLTLLMSGPGSGSARLSLVFGLLFVGVLAAWLNWHIVRAVWRNITSYQPPPKPVVQTAGPVAESAKAIGSENAKPHLPMRFFGKTLLLAALVWLLVPLLWNARGAGLAISSLAVGGMILYIARTAERYLPSTAAHWRQRTPFQRWTNLISGVLFPAFGVFFLFLGSYQFLDRVNWNQLARTQSDFRAEYQGAEHRLLQRLDRFQKDAPRAELSPDKMSYAFGWVLGTSTQPAIGMFSTFCICASLFLGMFMIWAAYNLLLSDRDKYGAGFGWDTFRWPATQLTAATLLPMISCAVVVLLILPLANNTMFTVVGPMLKTDQDNATVDARIVAWTKQNQFVGGDYYSWKINQVPGGENLAQAEVRHLWQPNVFDRWQMTWAGLQRVSPDIAMEIVGDASGKQTSVTFNVRTRSGYAPAQEEFSSLVEAIKDTTPLPDAK